jgi:hypothetical protein
MRIRKRSTSAVLLRSLRGWLAAGLCAATVGCSTVIEEHAYNGLALGVAKAEVLDQLDALPLKLQVQPALPRPQGVSSPSRGAEPNVVRLASAEVGTGALTDGEREYLLQYDLWYFEADDERAVVLRFADGVLAEINNRRVAGWFEALF